ncbi:MAG: putative adenylate/guanylate cyclase [Candidatus Scalindua rubra]|uniref:Putative adenylate/guanylate cyclase n=1 Tax=Candidatus Scalindua rubra TaxID=1872076 RepID=A0A1E3XFU4_9BACT|nr:MAG: putative adenylate/guanylate cyclase [Candidatus Scalindua rubra]
MKFKKFLKKAKDNIISVAISVGVFAFVLTLFNLESRDIFKPLRYFKTAELKALDSFFSVRGKRDPGKEIAIVLIDENSIKKLGRYPLPRQDVAKFVDIIADSGARVLVLDLLYAEHQNESHLQSLERLKEGFLALKGEGKTGLDQYATLLEQEKIIADADQELQNSFERAVMERGVNIVIGFRFVSEYEVKTTGFTGKELSQDGQMLLKDSAYFPVYVEIPDFVKEQIGEEEITPDIRSQVREMMVEMFPPKSGVGILNAIDQLAMWCTYQGFTDHNVNYSGGVSHEFAAIQYKGDFYPSLGIQTARIFLDVQPGELQFWLTKKLKIKDFEYPLDDINRMIINYCGPSYTFPSYSFIDVYEGKVEPEAFKDKVVFLGDNTPSAGDFVSNPFSSMLPGVEKQATIVENLIHGKFLKKNQSEVFMGLIVLDRHLFKYIIGLCLLLGIILPFVPIAIGGVVSIALLFGYYYYCYYNFVTNGLWINVTYPTTAVLLCFSSISLFRYFITERAKRVVKGVFENFMDPKVVQEVLKEPEDVKLGGEEKEVTVYFSDIEKFSAISEKLQPVELIELLNEYLSEMTDIILDHGGFLDKYIGDAIVAAFGAPLAQPDHAVKACFATIENQKRLIELNKKFKEEGRLQIKARIGLNSGTVLVGNVGSSNRLSYTVIGDEVNLGARLEAANKYFGTYTMISERTYELAKDHIEARELDMLRVVGKEKPVKVYELIDRKGEVPGAQREILELYEDGLREYRKREWQKAISLFQKAMNKDTHDGPSQTYIERCKIYAQEPPPEDWDGVYTLKSK